MVRRLRLLGGICVAVLVATSVGRAADGLQLRVLSSRPDMVSGGDALVRVELLGATGAGDVKLTVNGADATAKRHGAIGGKVTGAGGGGYMLFYCRYDRKHKVTDRLRELGARVSDFAFEPSGLRTWRADDR